MFLNLYKTPAFITFGNVGSGRGVVSKVNGKTGEVDLVTTDIPEDGDALYLTLAERDKLASLTPGGSGGGSMSGNEIKTLYEAEADTNAFTDDEKTKLAGVEQGATADQSGGEIKSLYEAEADTNAFTDAEKSKLAGISPGGGGNVQADVTTTDPSDGSYVFGMGTTGRELAQLETSAELQALVSAEVKFASISEMLASTIAANTGTVWQAGLFRYLVVSSAEPTPHLTTAGGVKLFVLPTDSGIYPFDAFDPAGDGVTDDGPKLQLALNAQVSGSGFYQSGPAVFLSNKEYFIGQTINLKLATRLFGNSSGLPSDSGPLLIFPPDTTGIIINRYNTTNEGLDVPASTAADASIIEGIRLASTLGSNVDRHGIWLRARAVIRNVNIRGFSGNGINIVASSGAAANVEGNANNWSLNTLRITGCGRNGVYVDGADVNAGVAIAVDASQNGRWGIWDSSFLGNTYLACHVAENGLANTGGNGADDSSIVSFGSLRYGANPTATASQLVSVQPGTNDAVWVAITSGGSNSLTPLWEAGQPEGTYFAGGGYLADNANARNLFLGCYSETGTAGSAFYGPSMVVGGAIGHLNQGSTIAAANGGELTLEGLHLADEVMDINIGGDPANGEVLKFSHSDDSSFWPWRLHRRGADFAIDNGNSGNRIALTLTGENTTSTMGTSSPKPYLLSVPTLAMGKGADTRRMSYAVAAPTSGEFAKGDIMFNRNPSAGGFTGWICVAAGSPGTWKTFGAIEA